MSKLNITVNGKKQEIDQNTTINNLLKELNINSKMFVVERNCQIIQKENFDWIIEDGDNIEIVIFCGGG